MLKKLLSVIVVLAMCFALISGVPLTEAESLEVTAELPFEGSGLEDAPYLIQTAADLQQLAEIVNGGESCKGIYFQMTDDIDLSGVCGEDIGGEELSWKPIGINNATYDFSGTAFCGSFDGGNNEISGLYINTPFRTDPHSHYTGLFGYVGEAGAVKNLRVNGDIKGFGYVGAVVGQNYGGTVDNCSSSCTVSGSQCVGGVVGLNTNTIYNCSNSGAVSGIREVGGVVGGDSNTIYNCSNSGTVSGEREVGGVAGYSYGTMYNCSNSGTISGYSVVGGVVGHNANTIYNCSNSGTISCSSAFVGGIAGSSQSGQSENLQQEHLIEKCYNTGEINAEYCHHVGGIAGSFISTVDYRGEVKDCYNAGVVQGDYYVGGIAAFFGNGLQLSAKNCYATNCYSTGSVNGNSYVGEVVGITREAGNVQGCYYREGAENPPICDAIDGHETIEKDDDSFASGEVAYLLQGRHDRSDLVWGQRLTAEDVHDDRPVLTDNEAYRVLKVTFMYDGDTVAVTYVNPDATLAPPTEELPEPPEGYTIGWTTVQNGEKAEFYDTVAIGDEDVTFYAVVAPDLKEPEVTPPQAIEGLVYSGDPQTLIEPGSAIVGTMKYSLDKNGDYSEELPTGTDADTYIVWYMVEGGEGYDDTEPDFVEAMIAKAYSYVKTEPKPIDREYDGEDKPLVTKGTAEGGTMAYSLSEDGAYLENIPAGKDIGAYTVYYKVIGDSNHYDSERTYSVTVNIFSAGQEIKPPTAKDPAPVYEPNTPQELIEAGSAANGTMLYRLPEDKEYSEKIPTGINAGEYTVYYMVKGNNGYSDIGPDEDKYYVVAAIAKADPNPTIPELTAVYGQTLKDIKSQLPEGYAWVDNTQSVGNVGTNYFPAIFTPTDTKNFNTLKLDLPVKVEDVKIIPPQARTGLVYNRTEQELIIAGSAANGTMVYKVEAEDKETGAAEETAFFNLLSDDLFSYDPFTVDLLAADDGYSERIPTATDAGKYTVWYKVAAEDGSDITAPLSLTVEIAKANPVPPDTDLNATVGQTLKDIEPQLPEGYAWVDNTLSVGNVGTNSFAATFMPKDTKNFNTLSLMLDVKVTEREGETTTTTTKTTTTTAPEVTTTTAVTVHYVTTTTVTTPEAAATTVTAHSETTTTTTAPEVTTTSPSTTSPPPAVTEPDDEDRSPNTGIVLVVAPFVTATITVVVSRKRK